jgi:hypothetical protein
MKHCWLLIKLDSGTSLIGLSPLDGRKIDSSFFLLLLTAEVTTLVVLHNQSK